MPSGVVRSMGVDHIQRPLVHGRTLGATWKPVLRPSSWFRMKDLPWRALPDTAMTPTGPRMRLSDCSASSPNSNLCVPVL